jgi:hypothetical protein
VGAIGADGGESGGGGRLMNAKHYYRFYYFLIIALLVDAALLSSFARNGMVVMRLFNQQPILRCRLAGTNLRYSTPGQSS